MFAIGSSSWASKPADTIGGRAESVDRRRDRVLERVEVLARPPDPAHIGTFSGRLALLARAAGARVERPLVDGDEQHAVVVQNMSCVPFPWCTSQSRIATRSSPSSACAKRAAIATLLKKQNPIAAPRRRGARAAARARTRCAQPPRSLRPRPATPPVRVPDAGVSPVIQIGPSSFRIELDVGVRVAASDLCLRRGARLAPDGEGLLEAGQRFGVSGWWPVGWSRASSSLLTSSIGSASAACRRKPSRKSVHAELACVIRRLRPGWGLVVQGGEGGGGVERCYSTVEPQVPPGAGNRPAASAASSVPCSVSTTAAVFAPTPFAPGILSEGSPRSAMKSGTCAGSTP